MPQTLYEDEEFKILKAKDFIVVRKNAPYEFHSHFKNYKGAKSLIVMFRKWVKPHDEYFHTAMQRITTEQEFNKFVEERKKDKYVNRKGRR